MLKKIFNKETILYLVFGVLTTVVNLISFKLLNVLLGKDLYLVSNVIAWFVSVIFAFIVNKLFVFESKSWEIKSTLKEIGKFFSARVFSLVVEEVGLLLLVDVAGLKYFTLNLIENFAISGEMISKVILAVIVVVMNYFFSKFFIFGKDKKNEE
ncbi:MAG: GtrA family protein [Clostridia bacterium]|nr:GtrA family protein [Clostridia bacterium]